MLVSNNRKFQKTQKTKFKRHDNNNDEYGQPKNKPKHHDRSFYKLLKQEKKDYEL